MMEIDENDTLEGQWVVDSETGIHYLIEVATGKVLMVRDGK